MPWGRCARAGASWPSARPAPPRRASTCAASTSASSRSSGRPWAARATSPRCCARSRRRPTGGRSSTASCRSTARPRRTRSWSAVSTSASSCSRPDTRKGPLMDAYAWEPTPERIEQANVTRLMRAAGVATIDELRRKSVEDIDWYWDLVVKDLGLPFDEPYTAVRDSSSGIEWTTWFVDGRLNVATACVDRWRDTDMLAVVHEDEQG